jgi:energy-coupling factor transporter transmembrane protein EcfT
VGAFLAEIPGSAKGVLTRRSPSARIACGAGVFVACLASPATTLAGSAFLLCTTAVWASLCGLPLRIAVRVLGLLAAVLLPLILLALLPVGDGWNLAEALRVSWALVARGLASTLVAVATVAALAPWELHEGLEALPLPRVVVAVLSQVVRQADTLARETASMTTAIRLRGGAGGFRAAVVVARALPEVWLPRVGDRAERTARAMEMRDFDGGSLQRTATWSSGDAGLAAATMAWTALGLVLRFWSA